MQTKSFQQSKEGERRNSSLPAASAGVGLQSQSVFHDQSLFHVTSVSGWGKKVRNWADDLKWLENKSKTNIYIFLNVGKNM